MLLTCRAKEADARKSVLQLRLLRPQAGLAAGQQAGAFGRVHKAPRLLPGGRGPGALRAYFRGRLQARVENHSRRSPGHLGEHEPVAVAGHAGSV